MAKRKLKKIEIIILVGFVNSVLVFLGIWLWSKAPNRDIYLPEDYEGWVRISHSVEGAPPLVEENGIQKIVVPDSGHLMTSTKLKVGWRRDRFFWQGQSEALPSYYEIKSQPHRYVFQGKQFSHFHKKVMKILPAGADTTLLDGTKIKKDKSNRVNYIPGKKALQYFYVSAEGRPLGFVPPPIEDSDALKSTEDRKVDVEN